MRSLLFSLATLIGLVSLAVDGRITGIAIPSTIRPGDAFNVTVYSENFIQSVFDVALTFGYAAGNGYPGSLGTVITSVCLGKDQSNQPRDFTKLITMPTDAPRGRAVVKASLTSLIGVVSSPQQIMFNVSVTLGDRTSKTYVSSRW
ncbi:hypothetical protein DCS_02975 [Drechmeria coniospora]|uniref:Secreted protein NIS1 n=1 Tax=Drechmeria coniospora TaxID=98403 RepID=A0A151GXN4_DRECN|nr:hypothetical protein DCS_02975 [Drechmeria coniospora]KYK61831.1 hypothetical protein DCS_02975 [Drechmeria coniospora]ODA82644.1 hypothetical protein RJ55_01152 [Drechmeria coniospora]